MRGRLASCFLASLFWCAALLDFGFVAAAAVIVVVPIAGRSVICTVKCEMWCGIYIYISIIVYIISINKKTNRTIYKYL